MNPLETLRNDSRVTWPTVLAAALAITLVLAIGVAGATSTAAFGLYNPGWEGTSDFGDDVRADAVDHEVFHDAAQYDDLEPNNTVAFVLAPDEPYADEDAERLARFVEEGGTLVVLENFGSPGDDLLERVGADVRTDGRLLLDEQHNHRGPALPLATGVENHTDTADVDELALNYATALEPGNATVLVTSSEYGYLGQNATDEPGDDDLAAYPVATTEAVGNGTVVAISDPSLAINAMYGESDNAQFLANLYAGEERVVFDLTHADDLPPLAAALLTIRATPSLQLALGLAGIGLALAASTHGTTLHRAFSRRLGPTDRPRRPADDPTERRHLSEDELASVLKRTHPEWDDERLERVIAGLNHARSERETDR